jgi:hypothetical protein
MNSEFPIIFVIYQWIKPASFGPERVYHTTSVSEKNTSTITVFQTTLSFTFHDEVFEPVSLPGDSLYINTRERHTGLNATYDAAVNRAWNATAQEMFLSFIIIL